MKILFATGNEDKLKQINLLLEEFQLQSPKDMGISNFEVVEDGKSLEENAFKKAIALYDISNKATLADDTGLFVKALDNRPGIHAHRYAGENATYKDNRDKLLSELDGINDRLAYFETAICYIDENGKDHYFKGRLDGSITTEEIGDYEFGYDQIFKPEGFDKTLGQMTSEEINQISHRSKAIEEFKDYIIKGTKWKW